MKPNSTTFTTVQTKLNIKPVPSPITDSLPSIINHGNHHHHRSQPWQPPSNSIDTESVLYGAPPHPSLHRARARFLDVVNPLCRPQKLKQ
ncbi:hypothetical protein M0R45_008003 [Rubus argutus]|uniref:Uncharacterized protein n=1 Tax=Rubus argutus TaxID=59490 RepID=A0AAW1Y3M2_RUBAR